MAGTSPTQRSIAVCKESGWPHGIVEYWSERAFMRVDLWGVIDILVLDDDPGVLAVQACAGASHATRRKKIIKTIRGESAYGDTKQRVAVADLKSRALVRWLEKGNRLEVWSWSKSGPKNKRKLWTLRRELMTLDMAEEDTNEDA